MLSHKLPDRLTRSYESVYFFVKSEHYYFDLDAIRKTYPASTIQRAQRGYEDEKSVAKNLDVSKREIWAQKITKSESGNYAYGGKHSGYLNPDGSTRANPIGANPGDVWTLTQEGLKEEHFAAFPQKLVKQILECSSPKEICNTCNKPRQRVVIGNYERKHFNHNQSEKGVMGASHEWEPDPNREERDRPVFGGAWRERTWTDCGCKAGFRSGLVLDPFAGAGTSLLVAHKMGYDWLGIELVQKYVDIINKRIERHGKLRLDTFMQQEVITE